jgi:hypothetical protein
MTSSRAIYFTRILRFLRKCVKRLNQSWCFRYITIPTLKKLQFIPFKRCSKIRFLIAFTGINCAGG